MQALWKAALPFIKARHWNGPAASNRRINDFLFSEYFFTPRMMIEGNDLQTQEKTARFYKDTLEPLIPDVPGLLQQFASLKLEKEHEFVRRDVFDLFRTIGSRGLGYISCRLILSITAWRNGADNQTEIECWFDLLLKSERIFADILAANREYSLYGSLQELKAKQRTNPKFEYTLKGNAENYYCRSYITELFTEIYLPELEVCREIIREECRNGKRIPDQEREQRFAAIKDRFYDTPLRKIAPDEGVAAEKFSANLQKLAACFESIIPTAK